MILVECHHSGAFTLSAITDEEAPLFAWILQIGRKRPPGKASLNSLYGNRQKYYDGHHNGIIKRT